MLKLLGLLVLVLVPTTLLASSGTAVVDGSWEPAGFEVIADVSSAVSLTMPDAAAKFVLIQAETQNIRWRDDGTDPTASVGMLLEAGQTLVYNGRLTSLRLIETTATATVNVSYYK